MKTISQLEKSLHSRHLEALNLYRFVQQAAFKRAYEVANVEEKEQAARMIDTVQQLPLTAWTKTVLRKYKEYDLLDVRYLRDLARDLGIRGYAVLTHLELVSILQRSGQCPSTKSGVLQPECVNSSQSTAG